MRMPFVLGSSSLLHRARLLGAVLACLLSGPAPDQAHGQDTGVQLVERDGFEGFRLILMQKGLHTPLILEVRHHNLNWPGAKETVIVAVGDTSRLWRQIGEPEAYLNAGGALLIATDGGDAVSLARLNLEFRAGPIVAEAEAALSPGFEDCPLVTKVRGAHPLFRGITQVATNRSGYLTRVEPVAIRLPPPPPITLAWLPNGRVHGEVQPLAEPPLMMTFDDRVFPRGGRLLAIADQSIFINEMLMLKEADNGRFAWNVANWLTEGGRRKYVYFYVDGQLQPELKLIFFPDEQIPFSWDMLSGMTLNQFLNFTNLFIRNVEENDVVNQIVGRKPDAEGGAVWQGFLVSGAAVLLLIGSWRLIRGRSRLPARLAFADDGPLLLRREAEALGEGNFGETAHLLARSLFPTKDAPVPEGPEGTWWQRWTHRRRVRRLRRLAAAPPDRRISARKLRRVRRDVAYLKGIEGEWRPDTAMARDARPQRRWPWLMLTLASIVGLLGVILYHWRVSFDLLTSAFTTRSYSYLLSGLRLRYLGMWCAFIGLVVTALLVAGGFVWVLLSRARAAGSFLGLGVLSLALQSALINFFRVRLWLG